MDNFLGEIRPFTGNFAPQGWHLCDGTVLNIQGNEALFALIGARFGGNGTTNFALPDLRGRLPIGSGQGTGLTSHSFASSGGTETVTLSLAQAPGHNHGFTVTTNAASGSAPSGAWLANPSPNSFYATTASSGAPDQVLASGTVSFMGNGQPHENRMPTMAINYIIATTGLYPVQP